MQLNENFIRHKDKRSRSTLFKKNKKIINNPINFNLLFKRYFISEENKLNFKKYLIELYHDLSYLSSEEEKGVSHETFFFFLDIPFPISNNIFKLLDKDRNNYLKLEEFIFGIYDIYGNNSFNNLAKFTFDIYDTDRDGLISRDDISLILNYLPVDRKLRHKYIIKDYTNIKYNDIVSNKKIIEKILNKVFFNEYKNYIDFDNYISIIQNKCSDIFIAILIYLYEAKPFNDKVINIYSYTDYDYLSNNKNSVNFKSIENIFKTKYNNNNTVIFQDQKIEMPIIELSSNIIIRHNVGKYTRKNFYSIFKDSKIEQDLKKKTSKKLKSSENLIDLRFNSFNNNDLKRANSKGTKNNNSNIKPIINEIYTQKKKFNKNIYMENNDNTYNLDKSQGLNSKELLKLKDIYEGNVFKITKKGKLKVYYMKLIKHDLFYYKTNDDKFHTGMHHLTNNIVLIKNKPQKYKLINLYSLSLLNQGDKHSFYFNKEDEYNEWYKHFQKAISYRNMEDFYILGEKIKIDQIKIIREIYPKNDYSFHHFNYNTINTNINNNKKESKNNYLICTQLIKPSNKLIKQLNESIFNQMTVFQIGHHKNLCKLYDIFQDDKYLYIITEKCTGDNILQYLRALDIHNPYKEEEKICEIIHQLLMVVYYLHNYGIVHRNIKPDSILMFRRGINSYIKLIDFNLSKYLNNNEKTKEPYGSVGYSSPEMLLDLPYDNKIDEWSIGILTYLLLCGKLPFSDEHSEREVARQTIHEKLSFTQPIWEKKSKEAKDFVNKLLNKDPKKRMSVKEALIHSWIKKYYPLVVEERLKKNVNYNQEGECIEFEKYSSHIFINNK